MFAAHHTEPASFPEAARQEIDLSVVSVAGSRLPAQGGPSLRGTRAGAYRRLRMNELRTAAPTMVRPTMVRKLSDAVRRTR